MEEQHNQFKTSSLFGEMAKYARLLPRLAKTAYSTQWFSDLWHWRQHFDLVIIDGAFNDLCLPFLDSTTTPLVYIDTPGGLGWISGNQLVSCVCFVWVHRHYSFIWLCFHVLFFIVYLCIYDFTCLLWFIFLFICLFVFYYLFVYSYLITFITFIIFVLELFRVYDRSCFSFVRVLDIAFKSREDWAYSIPFSNIGSFCASFSYELFKKIKIHYLSMHHEAVHIISVPW